MMTNRELAKKLENVAAELEELRAETKSSAPAEALGSALGEVRWAAWYYRNKPEAAG